MNTHSVIENSEIDLIKVLQALWSGKWFILSLTLMVTLCTFFGSQQIKNVYQAHLILTPPINNDLFSLNNHLSTFIKKNYKFNFPIFKTEEVYRMFLGILMAESTKRDFLKELASQNKHDKEKMPISIEVYRNDIDRFSVIVNAYSPEAALSITNQLINRVRAKVQAKLNASIQRQLHYPTVAFERLERRIALFHMAASNERKKQIAQQLEKIKSAQLEFNADSLFYKAGKRKVQQLFDELNKIKRAPDAYFVPGLTRLELVRAKRPPQYTPDFTNAVFARSSGPIEVSETYIRYKSKIFLVFSIGFGFILGCILIILRNFSSLLITPKITEYTYMPNK
ncbi:Wzz/FepE/Etk N-terminal domain-containing protein [Legionella clemsonensis]|uniref:Chain length determinant protein n=1 Tax=Legionella clemsonensis TaxID=1867846 RepID=A0A222P3J8_9GAMM|nr:Wzz/FepE/Etk N-terminal domain-containing protein [Legionella clemsonensis]ASQ46402.1 Chain length determinant protein [Legionella clemsonensis]